MSIRIDSSTDSESDVKSALGNQTRLEGKTASSAEAKVSAEEPAAESAEPVAASGTADDGEASEKPAEPGKVEEKQPGKNLDKRFAKLTRQRKEAEARAEESARMAAYWENEAKRRESQLPKPAATETKAETKPNGEPDPDKFDTYQQYMDAKVEWKFQQAEAERERKQSEKLAKESADSLWKSYSDQEKVFMKEHPDLQERIDAVKEAGIRMSPIVEDRIIRTGPALAHELMKDVDEFKALCAMGPNEALEHIGVVKAQLKASAQNSSAKPKDEKVVEIKQPKPISPVGARATVIKDPEKMSVREYDAWRRAGNSPTG